VKLRTGSVRERLDDANCRLKQVVLCSLGAGLLGLHALLFGSALCLFGNGLLDLL
jgi:hypothetical protein